MEARDTGARQIECAWSGLGVGKGKTQPAEAGITAGRPTWAIADSQKLMLSVWRKCKPVA